MFDYRSVGYFLISAWIKDSPVTIFRKPPGSGRTFRKLWEASAAIESTMPDKALPGPGTYETPLVKHSEAKGATSRFNSKVPKMPDPKENAKTPGPGAYDVLGHIEKASTETQERCEAIALSLGFGSLTERVGWSREVEHPYADSYNVTHVPGPGHYGDSVKESADREKVIPEKRKKLYGVHHPTLVLALQETEGPLQAFNTSDDRPCNKDLEQWTPAPWQYMPESARGSSINSDLKERAKVGRRGVFGTCADRFYRSPLNAKEGPENDWDGGKANMSKDPTSPEARSSFKSTSPRMRNAGAKEASWHRCAVASNLEVLILGIFLLVDFYQSYASDVFFRALSDNFCHASLAALLWTCTRLLEQQSGTTRGVWMDCSSSSFSFMLEIGMSMFIGSVVDVDHFLAAESFSLHAATHLTQRPKGHNLMMCGLLPLVLYLFTRNVRLSLIVFSAYLVHLLRDSVRRGLMLWPTGPTKTPPLPFFLVVVLYFLLPLLFVWILNHFRGSKSPKDVDDVEV
eukprot:symbB.v1.2.020553.t2/scaffold1739.1/size103799/1